MADTSRLRAMMANLLRSNPQSTAGTLAGADAYRQYSIGAQEQGQQPLPMNQWLQMQQQQQQPQPQVPQQGI